MKDKSRLIVSALILLIAASLFVIGMIVLPDVIVMQIKTDGSSGTTLPKIIGLLIPLALSVVFAVMYCKDGSGKNLLVSIIGLVGFALTFFMNR
jgi:lysylphosphatidylglycerol synthetase-like protein (DUF2156 family)